MDRRQDTNLQLCSPYHNNDTDIGLDLPSTSRPTGLDVEALRTSYTGYGRGRLEEVQNFLIDFETAFDNKIQFESSLYDDDDPNVVSTRVHLYSSRAHPYHKRTLPISGRRKPTLSTSRATPTSRTCEARATIGGLCDKSITKQLVHLAIRARRPHSRLLRVSPVPVVPGKHQLQHPAAGNDISAAIHINEPHYRAY